MGSAMKKYNVRRGDTPGSIAAEFAGCPRCSRDLLAANLHKPTVVYPNGYRTFSELREGETLNIPDKWSSKEFDELPPAYFRALPHPDGVTPSTLGDRAAGVLGDFSTLDAAAARVGALAAMGDDAFVANVDSAADLLVQSIADAGGNDEANRSAEIARAAAARARVEKMDLVEAISLGTDGFEARNNVLSTLSEGLVAARAALNATHADSPSADVPGVIPASTLPTLQPVRALVGIDPCDAANVARVCAAQTALGVSPDGKYGVNTADVARRIDPNAPPACSPRPAWWRPVGSSNCPGAAAPARPPQPSPVEPGPLASTAKKGISTAGIVGLGLLGVGTVGGAIYLTTRSTTARRKPRRKTSRR